MNTWQDSAFYSGLERIGVFLFANLVSVCLLLTIIGAPFALLGLFAVMGAWARGQQPEFFAVYIGAIRARWRTALLLFLVDVAGFGIIALNLSLFPAMRMQEFLTILSLVMTLSFGAIFFAASLFAWALLGMLDLSLRGTVKLSLLLTLGKPLHSLAVIVCALVPLALSLLLPIAFLLIVSLSVSAFIAARGVWWLLRLHLTRDQLSELL